MKAKYRRCCGIDVHKKSIAVCVLPPVGKPETGIRRRNFPTFTRDLKQLRTWMKHCQVTEIAMESTGQYWRSVWNLLEGHFEKLILVNPQHIKGLNGYKTDPKDAHWFAGLLEGDKLRGSWVPPREIRELRDLTRQRVHLLEDINRIKNRIEQLCQAGNVKLSSVASDIFGVTGRGLLRAVLEDRTRLGWIEGRVKTRLCGKLPELGIALESTFTADQRWLLNQELRQLEWLESQVEFFEREIERRTAPFEEPMLRLMTIPGIDRKTAWMIVAEIGVDMSVYGDAKRLASWAGLCPGNRESGGKRMSGRTRKANRYVRRGMCQGAWAASHTKDSYLSAFHKRIAFRRGAQKATMALAHHMMAIVYNVLARGEKYVELGADFYDRQNKPRVVSRLVGRLARLGYSVELKPLAPQDGDPQVSAEPATIPALGDESQNTLDAFRAIETAPKPRRGRPCKCALKGVPCKHGRSFSDGETGSGINPLISKLTEPSNALIP